MTATLKKILCIDDETDILEVLQLSLETVGNFDIASTNKPEEAIEKAREVKPDLIILDVMMPKIDGPTVLKNLQEHPELKHIPVILMTARVRSGEVDDYKETGACGVIPKPFDPMKISEEIEQIWSSRHE